MHRAIYLLFITSCFSVWGSAGHADERAKPLVGIIGGQLPYSEKETHKDSASVELTGNSSIRFTRWFGAKVRNAATDDDKVMGMNIGGPRFASALARVGLLPVDGRRYGIYGVAGYTTDQARSNVFGPRLSETDNSASFGAGVELLASERGALSIEFTRYVDGVLDNGMDFKIEHIGIGYEQRF